MCGIAGFFGETEKIKHEEVVRAIGHRGPDFSGVTSFPHGLLAHSRLSVIDPNKRSDQPLTSPDQAISVVFNGEIYNHARLREELSRLGWTFTTKSDTEVVLAGYFLWGAALFRRLDGIFAIAVVERETRRIILARDSLGVKPLVYHHGPQLFAFGSELKALLVSEGVPPVLNHSSLFSLLRFGAVEEPLTMIDGVFRLPPGHTLTFQPGEGIVLARFADLPTHTALNPTEPAHAADHLRTLLSSVIHGQMVADTHLACFLSGGLDSSLVLALMQQESAHPIQSFSVGLPRRFAKFDESFFALRVAKYIGADAYRIEVSGRDVEESFEDFVFALDQPSYDGLNSYFVSRACGAEAKVAMSGLGADELFGGYPHFKKILRAEAKRRKTLEIKPQEHRLKWPLATSPGGRSTGSIRDDLGQVREIFSAAEIRDATGLRESPGNPPTSLGHLEANEELIRAEIDGYLLNTLLRDLDSVSMRHGLEVRPPFLDKKIVEFALSRPENDSLSSRFSKPILRMAAKNLVPDSVLQRRKRGFELPIKAWLNEDLAPLMSNSLHSQEASQVFGSGFLSDLLTRTRSQRLGRRDWLVLVLIRWVQQNKVVVPAALS